jgi:hypothetical protein
LDYNCKLPTTDIDRMLELLNNGQTKWDKQAHSDK